MSAMPVVWCTGPNDNKPTAFALHGIQLQGNVSDQHVLAVKKLINDASEGRLILPSDGGVMMLDCGIGVGSVIVQNPLPAIQQLSNFNNNDESSKTEKNIKNNNKKFDNSSSGSCSSSCSSNNNLDQKDSNNDDSNDSNSIEDIEMKEGFEQEQDPYDFLCCAKCMNDPSNRCMAASEKVQVQRRRQTTLRRRSSTTAAAKAAAAAASAAAAVVASTEAQKADEQARKTSLDSMCTVSSLDSGFIEMLNKCKIENSNKKNNVEIIISEASPSSPTPSTPISVDNLPENTNTHVTITSDVKGELQNNNNNNNKNFISTTGSRSRRKSYEEFKSMFRVLPEDNNTSIISTIPTATPTSPPETVVSPQTTVIKTDTLQINDKPIKSRRKSYEEFKALVKTCDSLLEETSEQLKDSKPNKKFTKNLFSKGGESNTIYDIIQRKTNIYGDQYKNLEKYFTFGTIYEILRHKDEPFVRKRILSEKLQRRAPNSPGRRYSTIHESMSPYRISALSDPWNNNSTLSTIYDIIQTKKEQKNSRFTVEKAKVESDHTHPPTIIEEKPKLRKLSNIFKPENPLPEIDELYSKINKNRDSNTLNKSSSMDKLSAAQQQNEEQNHSPKLEPKLSLTPPSNAVRKISAYARFVSSDIEKEHNEVKKSDKRQTRRLSEFTRGEFLNEKA